MLTLRGEDPGEVLDKREDGDEMEAPRAVGLTGAEMDKPGLRGLPPPPPLPLLLLSLKSADLLGEKGAPPPAFGLRAGDRRLGLSAGDPVLSEAGAGQL